jgi:DNA-binding NarL/FixJ family response regulator
MVGRKVLVLWINPLFHETIRVLLQQADVEVVGALRQLSRWREQVEVHQPDTVIIETGGDESATNGETLSILRSGPAVIRLSLSDNELSLYKRQHKSISSADELIELILPEAPQSPPEESEADAQGTT